MKLFLLGLIISSNNFAVSIVLGSLGQASKRFRIALVFGAFEFLIPLAGLWIGRAFSTYLSSTFNWIGPSLLVSLGLYTLFDSWKSPSQALEIGEKVTTWKGLILLSLGLSLDNLIVGFSFGLKNYQPLTLAAVISICSITFAFVGLRLGEATEKKWESPARIASGLLLIFLAGAQWFNLF